MSDDTTSPFDEDNTKSVPDSPGMWFYHATGMPNTVIRKDDGELYFQDKDGNTMAVSEFARIKENNEDFRKFKFTKLTVVLDGQISVENNQQN